MVAKCANPTCNEPFDYRTGRLFFVHVCCARDEARPNSHGVQHFWLCAMCCEAQVGEFHNKRTEASEKPAQSLHLDEAEVLRLLSP